MATDEFYFYLWTLIRHLDDAMVRARNKELNIYGLSVSQSAMLILVKQLGSNATAAEIARSQLREPAAVTNILKRMEKDGLVGRVKNTNYKNQVNYVLKEKGEKAFRNVMKSGTIARIMSQVPEDQLAQLEECINVLLRKAVRETGAAVNSLFYATEFKEDIEP